MLHQNQIADCIKICLKCSIAGEEALEEYLAVTSGTKIRDDYVKILADCSQLTALNADFMVRESSLAVIGSACGKICEKVADLCNEIKQPNFEKYRDLFSTAAKCCHEISELAGAA